MSFKPYPKYKESGVEWLGRVPEHWEVRRLRQIGPLLKGSGGTKEDIVESGVPCVRYGDLYTTHSYFIRQARTFVTAERAADYFPIRLGDVLFAASGEDLAEIGRSAVNLIEAEAVCGGDTVVLRPDGRPVPAFLGYACDSWVAKAQKASMGRGTTVKHIYPDELKRLVIFVPSPDEQALIADFLDAETAKIDALIAEQQRLIELLQEKRQAVISHAVTKGLNPDAPMKDSGIEWLGEVPEHWAVAAVRFRYSVQLGKMLDTTKITGQHLRPYLRVFDVQWGAISVEDLPVMDFDSASRERFRLAVGDLLVNEGGSYPGRSAVWRGELDECYFQKALHRLRPVDPLLDTTRFFFYVMAWATSQGVFTAGGNESTIEHLPAEKFRKYRLAFPPLSEQLAIADFLESELARFEALVAEAGASIALLQERRSALISAAVTGQIDVRAFLLAEVRRPHELA